MNTPLPEDGPDRDHQPRPAGAGGPDGGAWAAPGASEVWTAVLEFARRDECRPFLIGDLEALVGGLDLWHPSGLWNSDRYAIQLQLPARDPGEALKWALAYHRDAALASNLPPATLVRVEIMTDDEFERLLDQFEPSHAPTLPTDNGVSQEVYLTTRRLLAVATPEELSDIIAGFVVAIGGVVEPGAPSHRPGTIDVDITVAGEACHATADSLSVTALIIEASLPSLLSDARRILARLDERRRGGSGGGVDAPHDGADDTGLAATADVCIPAPDRRS